LQLQLEKGSCARKNIIGFSRSPFFRAIFVVQPAAKDILDSDLARGLVTHAV
jgi:hypothetical protein